MSIVRDYTCAVRLAPAAGVNAETARVVFVGKGKEGEGVNVLGGSVNASAPQDAMKAVRFVGDASSTHVHFDKTLTVFVGLGADAKMETVRRATHSALERLRELKHTSAVVVVPSKAELTVSFDVAVAVAETVPLSNYCWQDYITEEKRRKTLLTDVVVAVAEGENGSDREAAVAAAVTVSNCAAFARDLGNERTNKANTAYYEAAAREICSKHPALRLTVLQYAEMREKGLGLICGVGQGALEKPRLILIDYQGAGAEQPYEALVGKGVVYDTGGLNIKGTGFMETMYMDMCGSAQVLATMRALAELGTVRRNVLGVMCMAENSVSAEAYLPSCILHSYKGLTVEVGNTDAEGRLVLADGMSYAQKNWGVKTMIDLATLTGANKVALGELTAGCYTNSDDLVARLKASSAQVNEPIWHMPIFDDHREEMKGAHSDLKNSGGRAGGGCTAAAFLERFVEEGVAWAHLDINGPAQYMKARSYVPDGATGFGVRLLCNYLTS